MQDELDASYPELDITILGCNRAGEEAGNVSFVEGRDIPFLQDVDSDSDGDSDVWESWDVNQRDLVIVDSRNVRVETINLTTFSLTIPENYELVLQMLIDAAVLRGDTNRDGVVNVLDIVPFVAQLTSGTFQAEADVNRDGRLDLLDVQPFFNLLAH